MSGEVGRRRNSSTSCVPALRANDPGLTRMRACWVRHCVRSMRSRTRRRLRCRPGRRWKDWRCVRHGEGSCTITCASYGRQSRAALFAGRRAGPGPAFAWGCAVPSDAGLGRLLSARRRQAAESAGPSVWRAIPAAAGAATQVRCRRARPAREPRVELVAVPRRSNRPLTATRRFGFRGAG